MLETILWPANRGVDVFRLDAVPFMWRRLGTTCMNQPEVHRIVQACTHSRAIDRRFPSHRLAVTSGPAAAGRNVSPAAPRKSPPERAEDHVRAGPEYRQ